jgi:hypothetical protein
VPLILGMTFLRTVQPRIDWGKNEVFVGKLKLPVCKYGSSINAHSMHVSLKSWPCETLRLSNAFELLNVEECENTAVIGSEVTPANDAVEVKRNE